MCHAHLLHKSLQMLTYKGLPSILIRVRTVMQIAVLGFQHLVTNGQHGFVKIRYAANISDILDFTSSANSLCNTPQ